MKIYTKEHDKNCVDFYFQKKPTEKQFNQFKNKGIVKIKDVIYISDELNLLNE